ncbi:oxidative stress-induced growth inhibitor 1-like isoform X2 [Chiloscyllium plagiosum]|uniref:oxidative stress-induced growth inhibitor 1-like isoform X2 n=1 Tax=Chiloscyllium plagiosum TaxID=36176 RepID=UPI001CB87BB9|nr:oxidative stress-induced growth inhibitor 1-like isoform X2 [Chiloscyllium plagiosum]
MSFRKNHVLSEAGSEHFLFKQDCETASFTGKNGDCACVPELGKTMEETGSSSSPGISPIPVVVIGNGPSAICLSYLLSGYRPYFKESSIHPNPILQRKLEQNLGISIIEQDLEYLSEGLEGRSHNPVAVLFDSLLRPDADFGVSLESVLTWRREPDHRIPHLVLGKGPLGGAWHSIEGSMFTLSLGDWMELPDLPFRDWMRLKRRCLRNDRAMTSDIASYYQHYARVKGLQEHFACGTVVTSVRRVSLDSSAESQVNVSADSPAGARVFRHSTSTSLFEVIGSSKSEDGSEKAFRIFAEKVVLATGMYDSPAWLGVDGEDLPFVHHTTSELDRTLKERETGLNSDPILIIGGGLTAADAIIAAHHGNVSVIHVFRRGVNDPGLIFNQLPKVMYPEYHKVHQMMIQQSCTTTGPYEGYLSLPKHRMLAFTPDRKCIIEDLMSAEKKVFNVSMAFILIGSNPNLTLLPDCGRSLAINPELAVNSKRNPLDVDCYTYECVQERGLYALGPLVGDHFVRFLQGGALAVARSLLKERQGAQFQTDRQLLIS